MISDTIMKEQLKEIEDALNCLDKEAAYALLKKYTGIEARSYTAYAFYDEADNWIGDSDNYDLRDLLDNAHIKVIEQSGDK